MRLPKQLRIGPSIYEVRPWTAEESDRASASGLTEWRPQLIFVDVDQKPSAIVDTLLHEALHVMWAQIGFEEQKSENWTEEGIIRPLATALIAFAQANPKVWAWIKANMYDDL